MKKKVYVFTGGASGLGLASARCLASQGTLLLCDRNPAALEKAKEEFVSFGADVETYQYDLTDMASVEACAKYAAELGDVYAVIHSAGVTPASVSMDVILNVNALGTVNAVKAFYPVLAEGGVMICFSSKASYSYDTNEKMSAMIPLVNEVFTHWDKPDFFDRMRSVLVDVMKVPEANQAGVAYCLVKYFVRRFALMNVKRFAAKNCRILSVSPGSYLTPMHQACIDNTPEAAAYDMASIPLKRWGHPYEMGELIAFLCSPGAAYINGVDILADGGGSLSGPVPQID